MKKFSCRPYPEAVRFLIANGIPFVYRKGVQRGRFMLFFIAFKSTAKELSRDTGCCVYDEEDDWDFDDWQALYNIR